MKSYLFVIALAGIVVGGCKHQATLSGLDNVKEVSANKPTLWKDAEGGLWYLSSEKMEWNEAQDFCGARAKETGKRWRLPSPEELIESMSAGINSSVNKAFGWVELNQTWSASWENSVSLKDKLLILGPASAAKYVNMGDGTTGLAVIDEPEFTTLCVNTDANGSEWADGLGRSWWYLSTKMNWPSAEVSCAELARRKRQPWRLPTREELGGAVGAGIQSETNKAFGRDYLAYTWSKEIYNRIESEEGYAMDLRDKKVHLTDVEEDLSVVCVRPEKF